MFRVLAPTLGLNPRGPGAGAEARREGTALAERAADEIARAAAESLRQVEAEGQLAEGELAALEREASALGGPDGVPIVICCDEPYTIVPVISCNTQYFLDQ